MNELVSTEWLHKNLNHPDLIVLDASLKTTVNRNAANTSLETIPESRYFDLKNNFSKTNCSLPNTHPNQTQFETECQKLGIRQNTKIFTIVDARSEGRFNGSAPEPRKHLKSGHIPDSINLPYDEVLVDGKFKSTSELKKVFNEKCNDKKELVFSCGSGLTACIVMLANAITFSKSRTVYDGSWTEWAERQNLKIDVL